MNIKNDVQRGSYAVWEKAFREMHVEQKKTNKIVEEHVEKYSVNKSVVWELYIQSSAIYHSCGRMLQLQFKVTVCKFGMWN
jgi:hypothetical protein